MHLQNLYLSGNAQLGGTLPTQWSALTSLKVGGWVWMVDGQLLVAVLDAQGMGAYRFFTAGHLTYQCMDLAQDFGARQGVGASDWECCFTKTKFASTRAVLE